MEKINKTFPGVVALDDVSIDLRKGEVLGILGENGAGKSTLIKILAGTYQKNSGKIEIDGKVVEFKNPAEAMSEGIRVIYQELNTLENLTVAENIFLGEQELKKSFPIINWRKMIKESRRILGQLKMDINPNTVMEDLAVSEKQVVEIAKAISKRAKILVMDEPTAALSEEDKDSLFEIIKTLKDSGVSIIYISHRLKEMFEITDRITVLRDGRKIDTVETKKSNDNQLVTMMVGRDISEMYPKRKVPIGEVLMKVKNLKAEGIKDVSFELRRGEILGIFGLLGSGKTHLVKALFGANPITGGEVYLNDEKVSIKKPWQARDNSIGLVPVDRKMEGLALMLGVKENITLANIKDLGKGFLIKKSLEAEKAKKWISSLGISTPSINQEVNSLSGGNQQKVVLARWLETGSKVIILNEPTRGIDVGSKVEIYKLMQDLCEKGAAVIMISSELPEILSISDRILVISAGRINCEFGTDEATEEKLMQTACIR